MPDLKAVHYIYFLRFDRIKLFFTLFYRGKKNTAYIKLLNLILFIDINYSGTKSMSDLKAVHYN